MVQRAHFHLSPSWPLPNIKKCLLTVEIVLTFYMNGIMERGKQMTRSQAPPELVP
jgi:hypothetical protein